MVYLIHFDKPYKHARHYLGFSKKDDAKERLQTHREDRGAKLLKVLNQQGIGYSICRIWIDGTRDFERKLKNRKESPRLCPICITNKLRKDG